MLNVLNGSESVLGGSEFPISSICIRGSAQFKQNGTALLSYLHNLNNYAFVRLYIRIYLEKKNHLQADLLAKHNAMDTANSFQLHNPDWKAVRSIYKKLSDEFSVLTNAYAFQLAPKTKLMLDHLIVGIDEVDQCVDELPTKAQRDELTNSMMEYFGDDAKSWNHELASERLVQVIQNLKYIVHELKVTTRFTQAATNIFKYTELKRHTKDEDELINYVCMEGEATAELPLSILQIDAAHPFAVFFTKLCTLMGVADLIVDARSDFKAKYIAKKPGISLYLKLNYLLIKEGISILWNFPRKFSFLLYCIRFTWSLITSEE